MRRQSWMSGVLLCGVVGGLVACGPGNTPINPSQVAIKVNGDEVSIHQVDLVLQSRPAMPPAASASAATQAALTSLVEQELAAQAALRQGLDRDPRVVQQLTAARRQVLAQAYQDRIAARAIDPSSDEIDRFHDENPELFATRRLFQLRETIVALREDRVETQRRALAATVSPEEVQEFIRREGLKSTVRDLSISAEDLPLNVLRPLARLKEGHSLVLPRDKGARVLTVLGSQVAPIPRGAARQLIALYLVNERKRSLIGDSMKTLRHEAKVEYVGPYSSLGMVLDDAGRVEVRR